MFNTMDELVDNIDKILKEEGAGDHIKGTSNMNDDHALERVFLKRINNSSVSNHEQSQISSNKEATIHKVSNNSFN